MVQNIYLFSSNYERTIHAGLVFDV